VHALSGRAVTVSNAPIKMHYKRSFIAVNIVIVIVTVINNDGCPVKSDENACLARHPEFR
jgi:hypothetical protein